jgi:RNA polymerase sigma factor (sigma-70 family)
MEAATATAIDAMTGWVRLAVHGDEIAFARIVEAHHRDMVRVCYLVCRDLDLADEAAQAAWFLAWQRLRTLREPARLRPWLLSIAANQARDLLRHRRRRPVVELVVADSLVDSRGLERQADDVDLRNALARLSPDDRALLALRYVAGLDSFELGPMFGRSASGTRARLARLLEQLRSELGHE